MSNNLTGNGAGVTDTANVESDDESALDSIYRALSERRRRYVIRCLKEFDASITLADLADEVAIEEYDVPLSEIDAEDVKEVYIRLYHVHIPMLSEAGLVEYDQESDRVRITDRGDEVPV